MAFLAVLREGFETVVFLLAAFNDTVSPILAVGGAVLGILIAVAIGYGIYRGGIRLNLSRFFRITGVVLVIVAAGLLSTAAHSAHEAGWLLLGQNTVADLNWVVQPGTVWSSIITGMFGIRPLPVAAEATVYWVYLVPMLAFVLWPRRRSPKPNTAVAAEASAQ
jgi:high-affinity iron transporter